MKKIRKWWHRIVDLSFHFSRDITSYYSKAWKAHLFSDYFVSATKSLLHHLNQFRIGLNSGAVLHHHIRDPKIKKLEKTALGLHSLLPLEEKFSVSFLLPLNTPHKNFLNDCIHSLLAQSAPHFEILIGSKPSHKEFLNDVVSQRIRCVNFHENISQSEMINHLAKEAQGRWLFIMNENDWLRPDLLYRFEQTLRLFKSHENSILACDHNFISDRGYFLPRSSFEQVDELPTPFLFDFFEERGLLISKKLWIVSHGLDDNFRGATIEKWLFDLLKEKISYVKVPLALYSVRVSQEIKRVSSQEALALVLENYSKTLGKQWKVTLERGQIRVKPPLPIKASILVIIPYKDQKELTLKAIQSIRSQENVTCKICALDNGSHDTSIKEAIISLGGEVLSIDEPFNYSRLNNLAVSLSSFSNQCDTLLFLNNDVELEKNALEEMLRWAHEEGIGLVGCALYYPNGRLQHGGVTLNSHSREEMRWEHIEKLFRKEDMKKSARLSLCTAVTAACAMVKKETFLKVGGFDEIWYPIGYSDTHLSMKISALGLKNFYTPYASGIHHESISRESAIEDFENSKWLHRHILMKTF